MQTITDCETLERLTAKHAVFILFGGQHCGVCQTLKPQLSAMIEQRFPEMIGVYVECEKSAYLCAQHSVFTLPVVKAYIDGMKVAEMARSFSIKQLEQAIERPYSMWQQQT
ncbi:MAG: thioredoxin family protein [Gammaproteobacteria bacterium]|nr:thioredoxin family protein [Gammaproteobacteria bacterium]